MDLFPGLSSGPTKGPRAATDAFSSPQGDGGRVGSACLSIGSVLVYLKKFQHFQAFTWISSVPWFCSG